VSTFFEVSLIGSNVLQRQTYEDFLKINSADFFTFAKLGTEKRVDPMNLKSGGVRNSTPVNPFAPSEIVAVSWQCLLNVTKKSAFIERSFELYNEL